MRLTDKGMGKSHNQGTCYINNLGLWVPECKSIMTERLRKMFVGFISFIVKKKTLEKCEFWPTAFVISRQTILMVYFIDIYWLAMCRVLEVCI